MEPSFLKSFGGWLCIFAVCFGIHRLMLSASSTAALCFVVRALASFVSSSALSGTTTPVSFVLASVIADLFHTVTTFLGDSMKVFSLSGRRKRKIHPDCKIAIRMDCS